MYFNNLSNKQPDYSLLSFPKFVVDWLNYLRVEKNLAPSTVANYATAAQTFLRWIVFLEQRSTGVQFEKVELGTITRDRLNEMTRSDISDFLAFCASHLGNEVSARQNKLSAIRSLYSYLQDVDDSKIVRRNPAAEVSTAKRPKPVPKFLTLEESKQLLDAVRADRSASNSRDYCIIMWLLSCGMRLTEIAGVNLKDIKRSKSGDSLLLRGKGRKERIVALNAQCMDALEDYLVSREHMKHDPDEQALFLSNQGKRISQRQIERFVGKYMLKAGLEGRSFSPHKLRHTSATLAYLYGGADVLDIQAQLGHSSIATSQIYIHTLSQNRAPIDAVGNLLEGGQDE